MSIKPIGHNLLIKPFADEIKYGRLHLPDSAKARSNNGIVFARGERCQVAELGMWVVFSRKQAVDVEDGGEQFILIDERACLVVLEEDDDAIHGGGERPQADSKEH